MQCHTYFISFRSGYWGGQSKLKISSSSRNFLILPADVKEKINLHEEKTITKNKIKVGKKIFTQHVAVFGRINLT